MYGRCFGVLFEVRMGIFSILAVPYWVQGWLKPMLGHAFAEDRFRK